MVLLHERHLRSFLQTWKKAKEHNIPLPKTSDSDYESLATLLIHVFRAARGYLTWMCEKLQLPDPKIDPVPETHEIESQADRYLEYLIEKWRSPLAGVEDDKFYKPLYTSRWGVDYCIDAMLEHAVLHPIRHEFQLASLLKELGHNKE